MEKNKTEEKEVISQQASISNDEDLNLPTPPSEPAKEVNEFDGLNTPSTGFDIYEEDDEKKKPREEGKLPEGVNLEVNEPEENIVDSNIESARMSVADIIGHMATVADVNREFLSLLQQDRIANPKDTAKALANRGFIINYK